MLTCAHSFAPPPAAGPLNTRLDSTATATTAATDGDAKDKNDDSRVEVAPVSSEDSYERVPEKQILHERTHPQYTAKNWSTWAKWQVLIGMLLVQISQNYNASVFMSASGQLTEKFNITEATYRVAQAIFLIMYAFGCELWAPFSEEFGRKPMIQASMSLVNLTILVIAFAPSWPTVFAMRAVGGLASAGGSVTLGMVADMFLPEDQFQAVAFTCFGSVVGSVIPPIVGGTVVAKYDGLACIWIAFSIGVFTQLVHLCLPETRPEVLLDRQAKKMRKAIPSSTIQGPIESRGTLRQRLDLKYMVELMWRPYKFLITEPIVWSLSLLSGFSDSLIFSGLDAFGIILKKWTFSGPQIGFSFLGLLIGYLLGYAITAMHFALNPGRKDKNNAVPEQRMFLLLYTVLGMPIGLLGWAFCSLGPEENVPWIAALLFIVIIGIANYAIYLHTIDYLVAAYGPYAASATGGNGFCRDFLAGLAALYTVPFYNRFEDKGNWMTVIPTAILAGIGFVLVIGVYAVFFKGRWLRNRSPYATQLEGERAEDAAIAVGGRSGDVEMVTTGPARRAGFVPNEAK